MCDKLQDHLVVKRYLIIAYAIACLIALILPIILSPQTYKQGGGRPKMSLNDTILYSTPQSLEFIYNELDKIAAKFQGEAHTWYLTNRNTSMYQKIKAIKLHVGTKKKKNEEKYIVMVAGMDPRAWYTAMIGLNLAAGLLNNCFYTVPLLTELNWIIIPVANPDGYKHITSHMFGLKPKKKKKKKKRKGREQEEEEEGPKETDDTAMRFKVPTWRKNKATRNNTDCHGVNLDRNFPFHFGEHKFEPTEKIGCSDFYPGPFPFSEVETMALKALLDKYQSRIRMFLYLTGNPDMARITYPWGFTTNRPYHVNDLMQWANLARERVRLETNAEYLTMQRSQNERSSGSLADYVMGYLGIKHTYIVETKGDDAPALGDDISNQIEQMQVICMEMGRTYNERGDASPAPTITFIPLFLEILGTVATILM